MNGHRNDERERRLGAPAIPLLGRRVPDAGWNVLWRATGLSNGGPGLLSALSATKTGLLMTALIGSTLAAGVSLVAASRRPAAAPLSPEERALLPIYVGAPGRAGLRDAVAQAPAAAEKGVSSSLTMFHAANREASPLEPVLASAGPSLPAANEPARAEASGAAGGAEGTAADGAPPPAEPARGKLVASAALGTLRSAGAAFQPLPGRADAFKGSFPEIYRPARAVVSALGGGARPARSAARRPVLPATRRALSQARFARTLSAGGARSANTQTASTFASAPFDGMNAGGQTLGGAGPGGAPVSGRGVGAGSPQLDVRPPPQLPPPPSVGKEKNVTPYQHLMWIAVAALGIGALLLQLAGSTANQAKMKLAEGAVNPAALAQALALFAQAKMLASLAALAGGVAAGMGAMIAGPYGQKLQGLVFIIGGGGISAMAIKALVDSESAKQEAEAKIQEGKDAPKPAKAALEKGVPGAAARTLSTEATGAQQAPGMPALPKAAGQPATSAPPRLAVDVDKADKVPKYWSSPEEPPQ